MHKLNWPVSLADNHFQLSYRIIEIGAKTRHTATTLREAIRTAGESVRNVVWTGWSMFYQFNRAEIAPRIVMETLAGDEIEAIETSLLGETNLEATLPDYWRITVDGRASIIRAFREDRSIIPHLEKVGLVPGTWLSPRTLIRDLYEFVTHAKELAKAFQHSECLEFRCSWYGLKGRKISEFESSTIWHERKCNVAERTSALTASVDQLAADPSVVVAELAAPVLRLFDGLELTRDWIVKEIPKFRML